MIRPYLPEWLKTEGIEFALECLSAIALGIVTINYLLS